MKLSVGSTDVGSLAAWQDHLRDRARAAGATGAAVAPWHVTRMFPKRAAEILAGGSLYWVVASAFCVRQRITGLEPITDSEGVKRCRIELDNELVPVMAAPRRPFQGWRYLSVEDAPADLSAGAGDLAAPDGQRLHLALSELGLL